MTVSGESITDLAAVPETGTHLFTTEDPHGVVQEVILVRCDEEPGVRAWHNTCTHEPQRFDRGNGAVVREGEVVCPKHGSFFDGCSGACENGPAAGTTLPEVEIAVEDGTVLLADPDYTYLHDGGAEDAPGGSRRKTAAERAEEGEDSTDDDAEEDSESADTGGSGTTIAGTRPSWADDG